MATKYFIAKRKQLLVDLKKSNNIIRNWIVKVYRWDDDRGVLYVSLERNGRYYILRITETPGFPNEPPSLKFVNPRTLVCDGTGWPGGYHIFPGDETSGWICLGVSYEYKTRHYSEWTRLPSEKRWSPRTSFYIVISEVI